MNFFGSSNGLPCRAWYDAWRSFIGFFYVVLLL
jgi:hypothetical protein